MLYKYLEYPKLPSELEAMCLDIANLEPNKRWPEPKNLDSIKDNHPTHRYAKYKQYMVPPEVIRWLVENKIVDRTMRIARIHAMFDGPSVYPHFDYPRTFAVNYLLTDSTATTCFYKHKTISNLQPTHANELFAPNDLELVDSIVLEHHRWHRLDVSKIHSIENITIPRIALTLSDK